MISPQKIRHRFYQIILNNTFVALLTQTNAPLAHTVDRERRSEGCYKGFSVFPYVTTVDGVREEQELKRRKDLSAYRVGHTVGESRLGTGQEDPIGDWHGGTAL